MLGDPIVWLNDSAEVLLRQAHPLQMKGTQPTSAVFKTSEEHEFTLSTRRAHIGAERAYVEHIATEHLSAGTWGVSIGEFNSLDLEAFDDSALDDVPKGHASVPYGIIGTRAIEKKARAIKSFACARGCLYGPNPV